jgi:hypothetical protein
MVRLIITVLLLIAGVASGFAQTVGPLIAPGPATSPYTPPPPAIAPGPAAPGIPRSSPIAPGPAAPQSSYNNPPAPAEIYSDRVSRCTHYGAAIGVQPNDMGSYVAQCVHGN